MSLTAWLISYNMMISGPIPLAQNDMFAVPKFQQVSIFIYTMMSSSACLSIDSQIHILTT